MSQLVTKSRAKSLIEGLVRQVREVSDLEGLDVSILRASEDELVIEVSGRRFRIYPDYDCELWDCSGDVDPSNPYLVIEEVTG